MMIDKNMPIKDIRQRRADIGNRLDEIQGRIWGDDYTPDTFDTGKVLTDAEEQEVLELEVERRKLRMLLHLRTT